MNLRFVLGAAAVAALVPLSASAALFTGELGLVGSANESTANFVAGDDFFLDFVDDGFRITASSSGDFLLGGNVFALNDLSGTGTQQIYSQIGAPGLTFTAESFFDFDNNSDPARGFRARGTLTALNFDPTPGIFRFSIEEGGQAVVTFSSQTSAVSAVPVPAALPLLAGALGGLGFMARRKKKTS